MRSGTAYDAAGCGMKRRGQGDVKPRIDTTAELERAMSRLIEEFRAPPGTPVPVAEAMMVEWATAQIPERYDLASEVRQQLILASVATEIREELEADPLATPEQIISRVGEQMQRDAHSED